MAHSYQKMTKTEIEKQNKIASENYQEIEKLFRAIFGKKVNANELELEDWKELFKDSKARELDVSWATKLYKWWLGRKFWLVDQKTEIKYHPDKIIF